MVVNSLRQVTHICVGKLTTIGSDNGLSPGRRHAIIWTIAGILLIGPLGTNFIEILVEFLTFSFKKMSLKVSSAKWWPFCLGLYVLTNQKWESALSMRQIYVCAAPCFHDDVIKWKHFLHYWPFVHQSPVNSPRKGQWHGALLFSLICAWINGWVKDHEAGELRCQRAHYDVTVMSLKSLKPGDLYMLQWTESWLVQIMACHLFIGKPLVLTWKLRKMWVWLHLKSFKIWLCKGLYLGSNLGPWRVTDYSV